MPAKVAFALIAEGVVFALILFGAAGRFAWPQAWMFLVLFFVPAAAVSMVIAVRDPALIAERMKPPFQKGQPVWDRVFMAFASALFLLWLVAMGFDAGRYRWSHMPEWLEWVGALLMLGSWWISYRVMGANTFLAPVVKIQEERSQTVISTGPYAIIRHPFYAGAWLLLLGSALVLGSWFGLALATLFGLGLSFRIFGEERELRDHLAGYDDYVARVRYRLIPFVW